MNLHIKKMIEHTEFNLQTILEEVENGRKYIKQKELEIIELKEALAALKGLSENEAE